MYKRQRLGIEMVYDYDEYKPYNEIEIIIGDDNNGIKYLPVVVMDVAGDNYDNNKIDVYKRQVCSR